MWSGQSTGCILENVYSVKMNSWHIKQGFLNKILFNDGFFGFFVGSTWQFYCLQFGIGRASVTGFEVWLSFYI